MNVFELLGVIAINNKDANKSIDDTGRKAHGLHSKMSQAFTSISKGAVACGKFVAKGMAVIGAAGAAATAALLKSSIGNYAEYEQLVGGIETLFKDSKDKVMGYAKNAYKTAGLSANDYMSTVTSFSASLLQGLGGDTAAAAEMANMAVTDMADNANKMGTDITMIQNAYQGFAKDNYTMLDNLKLGYGGTQEEMARLINDSGVMGDSFVATAENVKDISFAKIVEAIHVVQTEMGITGTTAKEATETITGSFNSWKSTWTNLMTGMADDENIEPLVDSFFDAGQDVLRNIGKVLPKIGKNLVDTVKIAGQKIKTAWAQNIWPEIQKFFKAKFGIELPAWENVGQSISDGWNNTVWPAIQDFFKTNFGIELPTWNDLVTSITTIWETTKENIAGFFSTIFVVDTEDSTGEAIGKKIREWWDLALGFIGNIFTAIFGVNTEDETGEGVGKKILDWWGKVLAFIGDIFCGFFRIDTEDEDGSTVGERIKAWWESVMGFVGDIFNSLFGIKLPSIQEIRTTIQNWWNEVKKGLGLSLSVGTSTLEPYNPAEEGVVLSPNSKKSMDALLNYMMNPPSANEENTESVDWRADGAIFNKPTIFNTRMGLQGVGEAGAEAVAPISKLQEYVSSAVQNTVGNMQFNIVLDSGVLVGQLAPQMDAKLGTMTARKGRRG